MKDIYQCTSGDGLFSEYSLDPTDFNGKNPDFIENLSDLSELSSQDLEALISEIEHGVSVNIHGGDEVKDYILEQAEKHLG